MQAIGIDVGGTNIRAALVDGDGKILEWRHDAAVRADDALMAAILALVDALRGPQVGAVGIALPCRVDPLRRQIRAGGFVDLSTRNPWEEIEDATGLPVAIENDGTMALLGEVAFGAARGMASAVLLTIGTGIGGGIIERGEVVRGRDTAGQLGHLLVRPGGRLCVCGARGCVEAESAGRAFPLHLAEHGLAPDLRAADLLALDTDEARAALHAWAAPLRQAIDILEVAFAPEAVLIGGGAGEAMLGALAHLPSGTSDWFGARIKAAALGDRAGVIGAAAAAFRLLRA